MFDYPLSVKIDDTTKKMINRLLAKFPEVYGDKKAVLIRGAIIKEYRERFNVPKGTPITL